MEYKVYYYKSTFSLPKEKNSYRERGKTNRRFKKVEIKNFSINFDESKVRKWFTDEEVNKRDSETHMVDIAQ